MAQSCDGFNKATYQSTTSVWDWRNKSDANWTARIDYGQATPTTRSIASPFEPSSIGQPNTQHLWLAQNTRDYEQTEGWELVYKDFGLTTANGVSNPHFILYNRFRGILRVFYCITKQQSTLSSSAIIVAWNGGKVSTLFESGKSSMNSNKSFSKNIRIEIPNKIPINEAFIWQFADIPVNYDPCTCNSSMNSLGQVTPNISSFEFGVDFFVNSTFKAEINQVFPDSSKIVIAGDYKRNTGDIFTQLLYAGNYLFGLVNSGLTKGNKIEKSITDAQNSIIDGYKHVIDVSNFLNGRDTAIQLSKNVKAPALFKYIPKIGIAIGFIESFFGGGKSADVNNTTNSAVPQRYSLSGSTSLTGQSSLKSIYTPGSPHISITGQGVVKPVYNYVMGVFGLLEEPKLEAVSHGLQRNTDNSAYYIIAPRVTKYRLKEPLKYAINPASELEVIDIQTSLEYQMLPNRVDNTVMLRPVDTTHKKEIVVFNMLGQTIAFTLPAIGPVFTQPNTHGLSYKERCEKSGIYIANWPLQNKIKQDPFGNASLYNLTYSTGFFNPSCHKKFSFAVADYKPVTLSGSFMYNDCYGPKTFNPNTDPADHYTRLLDFTENNLKITLKVKLVLRRKDANANSNTEDIIRILSYDLVTPKPYDNTTLGYNTNYYPDYYFNYSNCDYFGGNVRYGVDYYFQQFSPVIQGSVGTMPLGYGAYKDTIIIDNWNPTNNDITLYARKVIIVKTRVYANNGYKVTLRAGSRIIEENGGTLDPFSVQTDITSDLPGCEGLQLPENYTYIQNYCADTSRYYTVYNKIAVNSSTLNKENKDPITQFYLYPNPTIDNVKLIIENPTSEKAFVYIYDLLGKQIMTHDSTVSLKSKNEILLNLDKLLKGIYIVNVKCGDETKSIKLLKE